ncbi:SQS1_5 [Sanghuangporus weigelae]
MANLRVWCLLIDHEKKAAFGDVFGIEVHSSAYISDLKKKVKEERSVTLSHVDAAMLTVWRCTDSDIDFGDMDLDNFNDRLSEFFSPNEEKVKKLNSMQGVEQFKGEILFIEVPVLKDLRSGIPENRTFAIDEHTPRRPVKATEDLVQKTLSNLHMSDSSGIATIPAKRPRISDGIQSYDVYQSSAVVPLDEHETNSEHRLSFVLYSNFWKKGNLEQMIHEEPHSVPDVDLSSFPDSDGMSFESDDLDLPTTVTAKFLDLTGLRGWSSELAEAFVTKILIRKEYEELDEFLKKVVCSDDEAKTGRKDVLLVGQPGIGKTVYLSYCLLKRLSSGRRTIFSFSPTRRYLFQDSGAFWIPNETISAAAGHITDDRDPDALILFDLNSSQPSPSSIRNWRTVVASSPKVSRWKHWQKEKIPKMFVMKTWTWEEIYISRNMATVERSDVKLSSAFLKYGGSARHLLRMDERMLEKDTLNAVQSCNTSDLLLPIDKEFKDEISSYLVEINPSVDATGQCDRSDMTSRIISKAIVDMLMEQRRSEMAAAMERNFHMLMSVQATRSAAGLLFEGAGHRWLYKSRMSTFRIRSLSNPKQMIDLNLSHLSKMVDFSGLKKDIKPFAYYRPLSTRLPGVDSFALELDSEKRTSGVVLFQFTVADRHPIKTGFVNQLWKVDAVRKVKWKLVFIVPEKEAKDLTEQPWTPASQAGRWRQRVDQYVLGVDDKVLWMSVQEP